MIKWAVGVVVLFCIFIGIWFVMSFNKGSSPKNYSVFNDKSDAPPVKLKGIGVNLGEYDPKTKSAGDIVFTDHRLSYKRPFDEYGSWILAENSATGKAYRNAQATFVVPVGTKVRALVDGFVIDVPKLYSGDYSVVVAISPESRWRFETEHVDNPIVKPGDFVKAGQVVAEASRANLGENPLWGWFEIGIGKGSQNEDRPQHVCPFAYLDDSIKEETLKKMRSLMLGWEEYREDSNIYDETATQVPGCLVLEAVDG